MQRARSLARLLHLTLHRHHHYHQAVSCRVPGCNRISCPLEACGVRFRHIHDSEFEAAPLPDSSSTLLRECYNSPGHKHQVMAMRERAAGWLWLRLWPWGWLVGAIVVFGAFGPRPVTAQQSSSSCPLDFTVLEKFPGVATQARVKEVQCLTLIDGLEMVLAAYVRNTSYFLLPPEVVPACLADYQAQLRAQGTDANVTGLCELDLPAMLSRGHDNCQGIQRTSDLAAIASRYPALQSAQQSCAGPLADDNMRQTVACSACIRQLASLTTDLQAFNASGVQQGCQNYSSLYAAAVINTAGPLDPKTAACLFAIFPVPAGKKKLTGVYVAVGAIGMAFLGFAVALSFYYKHRRRKLAEGRAFIKRNTDLLDGSMRSSDGSIMFTIDELKAATRNFSRDTIIGSGAYGNVYKGVLISGVEVAIKRFKNCSPAGDKEFVHEVQMISSCRHKNLVALRGCCVAKGGGGAGVEGHQRIIVIDYLPNGSLQDYMFKSSKAPLDWPTRRKIAVGVAKGLDYLHHSVVPAILHRDIKSSNILLDVDCNACVVDFGLARLVPEGFTHVSTRAAGTFGYVAPEYAMYGQLTERSDVYSFGVVMLEIISGRKALNDAGDFALVTDWAWDLVKAGRWEQVLDARMGNRGPAEDMERFVMLALLCAHPLVACRPNMTGALRILENNQKLPSIPDRLIPLTANRRKIERLGRSHDGDGSSSAPTTPSRLFSEAGFRSFGFSASEGSSRLDGR